MARKKSRSRSKSSALKPQSIVIGGLVYGAARAKISETVRKFVPGTFGAVSDEILMGILSYIGATKGKGLIRDASRVGLGIEASSFAKNFKLGTNSTKDNGNANNNGGATFS